MDAGGFDYFKNWLILQGQYAFGQALKDPDALAALKIPFDDTECEDCGYEVIVFDLINPLTSFCYNPFVYVQDDKDVLPLISNLIQNTTPSHSQSSDPFWESVTRSLTVKSRRTSNGYPLLG